MLVSQSQYATKAIMAIQMEPLVETSVIESRFGEVIINEDNRIFFPYALPGIPNSFNFCLANLPRTTHEGIFQKFKVLQSLDDTTLSFAVLPLDKENSFIETQDLLTACEALAIKEENLLVLLIVSVHRTPDSVSLSVNTRAPVLVDAENKLAAQFIFMDNKYKVRHML